MKSYNVAVVGATGVVGHEVLRILFDRKFPVKDICAVASEDSLNKSLSFGDGVLKTRLIDDLDFTKIDIAFFCAGEELSMKHINRATKSGCIVIDKSSFYRMDQDVPLIVPEVNLKDLSKFCLKNIIANPNCCVIALALVLKPLDEIATIQRLVISTYQSVSGAGRKAMDELYEQTKSKYIFGKISPKVFPKQIAFNLIPYIGKSFENASTSEEVKISKELSKVIGKYIKSSVTCVRVPIFNSHSISLNINFKSSVDAKTVKDILSKSEGVEVCYTNDKCITPIEVVNKDLVYVSRIRDDDSLKNSLNLWITYDNLKKGAALNSVQIAEELIKII